MTSPQPVTAPPLLAPRCLFDTSAQSRLNWASIVQKAWKSDSWDECMQSVDLLDMCSVDGPIILRNSILFEAPTLRMKRFESATPTWNIHWILEEPPVQLNTLEIERSKHLEWFMRGLKMPWFCFALLGDSRYLPFLREIYFAKQPSSELINRVVNPICLEVIQTLRSILPISDRLAVGGAGQLHYWPLGKHLENLLQLLGKGSYISMGEGIQMLTSSDAIELVTKLETLLPAIIKGK